MNSFGGGQRILMSLDEPEKQLIQALSKYHTSTGRLYLACSGGRDSLALAYACVRAYQIGILSSLPILIHVNHRLQALSDDWAVQVANFAKKYDLDCHIATLNLNYDANENDARQGRYQAFFDVMADGDVILLAHHANDQCETLLMRLVNGAGVQGLSAMRVWKSKYSNTHKKTIYLLRPWLDVDRKTITAYAHTHQLDYIDDPTNDDKNSNVRTCIRHQLMPLLNELNPKAVVNIARSAKWLGEADDLLIQQTMMAYRFCFLVQLSFAPWVQVLDIDGLKSLDERLARQVLRHFAQGDEIYPPNATLSDKLWQLVQRLDNNHQTELYWQVSKMIGGFWFCRYRNHLYRYRDDMWQLLTCHLDVGDSWQINEQGCYYLGVPKIFITLTLNTPSNKPMPITLPKKHAQRLGIPPWLRQWLWQVSLFDGQIILLSLGQIWTYSGMRPDTVSCVLSVSSKS